MPLRFNSRQHKIKRNHSVKAKGVKLSISSFHPKAIKNYVKYLFTTKEGFKKIGTVAVIFFGLIIGLFGWYAKDLPTPDKINSRLSAQTTQIYDRNGKILYEMHGDKNRILVEFDEIPQNVKNATIAVEDKNFYKHKGMAPLRILRSAIFNIFERTTGANLTGGSTITQQFVKNALLSPEQTFTRKVKELILSMEIEVMYKKDDILKMYLNEIPYGLNAYGVKVAAKTYFDKELSEITLEEAAILAALPQAPTYYSPFGDNKDDLLARKDLVLQLMADQKYITQEEANTAKGREIAFSNNPLGSINAPHFVMHVKSQLVEKYGEKMASEGGLKVYTTLDLDLYNAANVAIREIGAKNAKNYNASNAGLVSIEPKTGQILAMVGSRDYFNQDIDGNVNITIRNRQPGSSFKPIAYANLLKKDHWGAGSIFYDLKTDFGGGYIPKNYDDSYRGNVTMRQALQGSLNIPAVKSLYIGGLSETIKTAQDLGITTLNNNSDYGLSLVLGSGEVKPLEMAHAYATFANGGIKQDLSWFIKIEDNNGKVLEEYKQKPGKQILDTQIAYIISNMLSDNQARSYIFGSRSPLYVTGYNVAAKTGTTDDNKDAWTVGYTPSISTAVWAGNNDGTKMTNAGGVTAAAPIWNRFMKYALTKVEKKDFRKPPGIKTVTIDALTGRKITSASQNKVTDIFPSWYNAPEVYGRAQEVKIDKLSGKLATAHCPEELLETKVYSPISAEIPPGDVSYMRWNAAVQDWAKSKGLNTDTRTIPTESCDLHNGEGLPVLEFMTPTNGQNISSPLLVRMSAATPKGFESLIVTVNGKTYNTTLNGTYYETTVKFPSKTKYNISATLTDAVKQKVTKNIEVNVTTISESSAIDIFRILGFSFT